MNAPGAHAVRLAAYVLTLNEEGSVAHAVRSLRQVTDDIIVLDSGSSDRTADEATRAGAIVHVRAFDSFERQRNFAVHDVVGQFNPDWIVTIDADERISANLAREIGRTVLARDRWDVDAYTVPRILEFEGRILRHGGLGGTRLIRLYRPSAGRYENRPINEHFELAPGRRLGALKAPLEHGDVISWEHHIAKHNSYSTLEAIERAEAVFRRNRSVGLAKVFRVQHLRRRWIREHVWNRLPAKPFVRFIQMYVVSGGFLDGGPGFDVALFKAWQELCTERKFREIMRKARVAKPDDPPF